MHYLAAYPETVKSLLANGVLPASIPSWLCIDKIACTKKPYDCQTLAKPRQDQTFLLALNLPDSISQLNDVVKLEKIETGWIKEIYVSSQRSFNLFNKFIPSHPYRIIIEPKLFRDANSLVVKRPREAEEKASESSKISKSSSSAVARPKLPTVLDDIERSIKQSAEAVYRIADYDEHLSLLEMVFRYAKKSILITSFSLNQETFEKAKLFWLIPQAIRNRIKIYIYYNDQKELAPAISDFLKEQGVVFDCAYTHSKLLMMDRKLIAAGSCNWLSMVASKFPKGAEGSLVIQGDCEDLGNDIWDHLKFYRNLQFDNGRAINRFLRDPNNDCHILYDIDAQNKIGYLPSLNEHLGFLQEAFEMAKQRVILCSPFISSSGSYKEDLDYRLIKKALDRGVEIFIVSQEMSPHFEELKQYLSRFNSESIQLIGCRNIHLKTIIIDKELIAESSFNWLSASRSEESDYHNHEQTFFIQGPQAKKLIERFYASPVGTVVDATACEIAYQVQEKKARIHTSNSNAGSNASSFISTVIGGFCNFFRQPSMSSASVPEKAKQNLDPTP